MIWDEPAQGFAPSAQLLRAKGAVDRGNAAVLLDLYKVYPDILLQPLDVDYSPTLLHLAAVKLKRGLVQAVLGLPRVIVDIEDENGQTPFCWVVTISNFSKRTGEVAGDLQQAGADVNHRDWNGRTALHLAVVRGSKDDVRRRRVALLLSLGADPRLKDDEGMRPIDYVGQTTDGGSWCTSLPDNRRERDRVEALLQEEMHRRDVKLLLLLVRRAVFGEDLVTRASPSKGGGSPQTPCDGKHRSSRRRTRGACVLFTSLALNLRAADVAVRLVRLEDQEMFKAIMTFV